MPVYQRYTVAELWLGRDPVNLDHEQQSELKSIRQGQPITYESHVTDSGDNPAADNKVKLKHREGEELAAFHSRIGTALLRNRLEQMGSLVPIEQAGDICCQRELDDNLQAVKRLTTEEAVEEASADWKANKDRLNQLIRAMRAISGIARETNLTAIAIRIGAP